MSGETVITIVGNLTDDPELRYTGGGAAVANVTVACTPRHYDNQAGEWRDGQTSFMRCSQWREPAENVAESLRKGHRVIVQGILAQRFWEERDGTKRNAWELNVQEVAPTLKYATATVTRSARRGGGGQQQRQQPQQSQGQRPPADDPWARPSTDEPPF